MDKDSTKNLQSYSKVFFEPHKWYAVTLAPNDHSQFFGKKSRMEKFINRMNERFMCYTQYGIKYWFAIELSEPRSKSMTGPRLHLHGKLRFSSRKSVKKFLLDLYYLLTRIGMVDIDTIDDEAIWDTYCKKQQYIICEDYITNCDLYDSEKATPEDNDESKDKFKI